VLLESLVSGSRLSPSTIRTGSSAASDLPSVGDLGAFGVSSFGVTSFTSKKFMTLDRKVYVLKNAQFGPRQLLPRCRTCQEGRLRCYPVGSEQTSEESGREIEARSASSCWVRPVRLRALRATCRQLSQQSSCRDCLRGADSRQCKDFLPTVDSAIRPWPTNDARHRGRLFSVGQRAARSLPERWPAVLPWVASFA
jgi:hypothetical protein